MEAELYGDCMKGGWERKLLSEGTVVTEDLCASSTHTHKRAWPCSWSKSLNSFAFNGSVLICIC